MCIFTLILTIHVYVRKNLTLIFTYYFIQMMEYIIIMFYYILANLIFN